MPKWLACVFISGDQPGPSRCKVTYKRAQVPLSATAKQLGPWATAKKELAELQMKLLQEQHDAAQEREAAAQKREEELFQLKKESLELKIKIRREKLKLISE